MSASANDSRFSVPPLPPHHVSRPRLLEAVEKGATAALTLVSAGPGAGKTVLLSEWARSQSRPVAWLALTPRHDNPRGFWQLVLEAGMASGQTYPVPRSAGHAVELLDAVFGATDAGSRLTMVVDDAHVLTATEILEGLDRIVRRWSHRVRLIMTARSDPLLPLHQYRLAAQVCELRAADLAMTVAEAGELLDRHGVSLPEDDLRLLMARTEGWSAGLRLAALRMQRTGRPEDFVAVLAMDQGSIGEYLTEEVLATLPEQVRRLLAETSFLDEVDGPLADAVTGLENCTGILDRLARSNSFVVPTNAARTTFRYHQLLREVLRHLANRQPSERVRERYARAAAWYRNHDDVSNALRWVLRSQDPAAIRSVLVHSGLAEAFVKREDLADIGLFALAEDGGLPADATSPELLEFEVARRAVTALTIEPSAAADALADLVPLDPCRLRGADPDLVMTSRLVQLILAQKAGDVARTDRAAQELLADDAPADAARRVPGMAPAVLLTRALSRLTAGRLPEMETLLRQALDEVPPDEGSAVHLEILSVLAFVEVCAARPRHADEALRRVTELAARNPRLGRPAILYLARALRAELDADWETMGTAIEQGLGARPGQLDPGVAAAFALARATYLLARNELGEARYVLRHDSAINQGGPDALTICRDLMWAEIEVLLGRPQTALRILKPHQQPPRAVTVGVVAGRAYLALGDVRRARAAVRGVLTAASPFVTRRTVVEAMLCEAEIVQRDDEGRAAELLERALQIADGDFALPFVRAVDEFAALLSRHATLSARWPARERTAVAGSEPRALHHPAGALPDELTHREQAVLRLMITNMSTAEMADELRLSVNTVKSHLASIYRKLAVGRRRDAVFRARELELL